MKKKSLLALLGAFALTACQNTEASSQISGETLVQEKFGLFGTNVQIRITGASQDQMTDLFSLLETYDALTDAFNPRSLNGQTINNLYTLNLEANEGRKITIDPKLKEVLEFGLEMQQATTYKENGVTYSYFNPFIGAITTEWKRFVNPDSDEEKIDAPLTAETLTPLLNDMNSTSLTFDGDTVTRNGKGLVDVGAFAKGFALRKAKNYLDEQGLKAYLINAGTSSLLLGCTRKGDAYTVSLQRPSYGDPKLSITYPAKFEAVGTSGISEQYRVYEGKTYTHIVDPKDGSAEAHYDTVTIKTGDPALADVLSTVIFLGGSDAAEQLSKTYDFGYLIWDGTSIVDVNDKLGMTNQLQKASA